MRKLFTRWFRPRVTTLTATAMRLTPDGFVPADQFRVPFERSSDAVTARRLAFRECAMLAHAYRDSLDVSRTVSDDARKGNFVRWMAVDEVLVRLYAAEPAAFPEVGDRRHAG